MPQANQLISVVDDDPSMSRMLCRAIKAAGLSVDAFGSAEEFLDSDASRASVCLILDMNLPGMSGLELQQRLNASRLEVPIIFMSAQADETTRLRALKAGAVGFLRKPFSIESLLAILHQSTGCANQRTIFES
jgi:FixJ family two-component response regulator